MKFFSCQPDTHNGFGALNNCTLSYIAVERPKDDDRRSGTSSPSSPFPLGPNAGRYASDHRDAGRPRSSASSAVSAAAYRGASPPTPLHHSRASNQRLHPGGGKGGGGGARPHPMSPRRDRMSVAAGDAMSEATSSATTSTVRVQYMVALPECFHATHSCFSMANYSLFGTDMSFVGTSKGLLALVLMEEKKLIYAPLKDPRTVSEEAFRYQQLRQEQQQREALFGDRTVAGAGGRINGGGGGGGNRASLSSGTKAPPSPPYSPYARHGEGSHSQPQHARSGGGAPVGPETPSTITWMRDMPLVLVGYNTGKVEWFRVYVSAAKRQQIDQRRKEHLDGAGLQRKMTTTTTSNGASAHSSPLFGGTKAHNRPRRQVQFHAKPTYPHEEEQEEEETETTMPASQFVHHLAPPPTGTASAIEEVYVDGEADGVHIELVASCLLPGAGALLSSDYFPAHGSVAVGGDHGIYLFSTECMERPVCSFTCFGCDYLYCHPLLPVIGTLSNGWRAKEEVSCWHLEERASVEQTASSAAAAAAVAAGDMTEKERFLLSPVWPSSASHAPFSGAVLNFFELVEAKPHTAAAGGAAGGTKGEEASSAHLPSSGGNDKKDKLMPDGAWLVHVLQHRIPTSSSQRYNTACSFSWKFSIDLELALCNLEEDMVHVVRAVPYLPKGGGRAAGAQEIHQLRYRVLRESDIHFPLHSSVLNVEYVSAATSVLALPSAAAATTAETNSKANRGAPASATSQLFAARQLRQWRPAKPVALKEDLLAAEMMDLAVPQPQPHQHHHHHHHPPNVGESSSAHHRHKHRPRRGGGGEEAESHLAVASSGPVMPSRLQLQQHPGAASPPPAPRAAAWTGVGVAPGQGPYSHVVGMSAMGEVLSVPVENEALAVWGSEQSALCCVGVTLYEATVTDAPEETVGSLMRRRLEAGFALSTSANEEVLRRLSAEQSTAPVASSSSFDGGTMHDWRIFFTFAAMLERVQVVGPTDDIPSLLGFVQAAEGQFPLTVDQLVNAGCFSARVAQRSKYSADPRRLLILHVLGWLPAEAEEASWAGLPRADLAAAVERAVVLCVLHDRHTEGAQLLRRYRQLSPAYETLACLLEKDHHTRMAIQSSDTHVREAFLRSLSPWLLTAFLCIRDEAEAGEATALLQHTAELLSRPQMPLWDRVAMAVLRLPSTRLLSQLLREEVLPYCSAAQALLLVHGVAESTASHMQRIVDVTGDCQIAACLYARVAVRCCRVIADLFQEEAGHDDVQVAEEEPLLTAPTRTPDAPPSARVRVAPGQHHTLVASSRLPPPPAQRHPIVAAPSTAAAAPLEEEEGAEDCPWLWWAADYRRFMDEEHAFVHRTTFDVACRQLRQGPCPQAKAAPAPNASPPTQGEDGGAAVSSGGGGGGRFSAQPIVPNSQTFFTLVQAMRGERPVCSVCREVVRAPGATSVTDGFVWCTNCGHGGHMEHLATWFAQHRRCAEFGCTCHCDGCKFL